LAWACVADAGKVKHRLQASVFSGSAVAADDDGTNFELALFAPPRHPVKPTGFSKLKNDRVR
jgi:hypothetical protein